MSLFDEYSSSSDGDSDHEHKHVDIIQIPNISSTTIPHQNNNIDFDGFNHSNDNIQPTSHKKISSPTLPSLANQEPQLCLADLLNNENENTLDNEYNFVFLEQSLNSTHQGFDQNTNDDNDNTTDGHLILKSKKRQKINHLVQDDDELVQLNPSLLIPLSSTITTTATLIKPNKRHKQTVIQTIDQTDLMARTADEQRLFDIQQQYSRLGVNSTTLNVAMWNATEGKEIINTSATENQKRKNQVTTMAAAAEKLQIEREIQRQMRQKR